MGILSNPKTRHWFGQLISRYNNRLCCLCYVVGLGWFLALAYQPISAATYISENALLPGLVDGDFYGDPSDYLSQLKVELRAMKEQDSKTSHQIPSDWLETRFRELGLDSYTQNYTFKYPAGILRDTTHAGRNVYAILRAPRIASTEAIVLSAPFRPDESPLDRTNAGIALMLQLAKSFRRHTYWAKDIIFLVTEHEQIGMEAWLSAYHQTPNQYILPDELSGRGGSIQAALNLELGHEQLSRLNVKVEGLNGQLANLDLVNTATRLCRKVGIEPTQQKRVDHREPESVAGFRHSLGTMLLMMRRLVGGAGSGNHALFHQYNIEAVTLQSIRLRQPRHSLTQAGSVVEGVVRSLNNLLERFHQSFFFYLLPSSSHYVSIGLYMPPLVVIVLPFVLNALALWIELHSAPADDAKAADVDASTASDDAAADASTLTRSDAEHVSGDGTDKPMAETVTATLDGEKKVDSPVEVDSPLKPPDVHLLTLVPWLLVAVGAGYAAHRLPSFCFETAALFRLPPAEGLTLGAIALHVAGAGTPWMLTRRGGMATDWRLLKCVLLLYFSLVLAAVGAVNVSLAFLIAAATAMTALVVRPTASRLLGGLQFLLLQLVSPLGVLAATAVIDRLSTSAAAATTLASAWRAAEHDILSAVIGAEFFGNRTVAVIALAIFPAWVILLAVPHCRAEEDPRRTDAASSR